MSAEYILETRNLTKDFKGFVAVSDVSLKVRRGEAVKAGQPLGEVGSSGDSSEPHLHYQLRSRAEPNCPSLPALFRGFRHWLGSRALVVDEGYVNSGDIVEAF